MQQVFEIEMIQGGKSVALVSDAGMRRPRSIETWAEQAELAAKGDWDALEKLQDELSGGRRT
mgnify:CR=1 FL=1